MIRREIALKKGRLTISELGTEPLAVESARLFRAVKTGRSGCHRPAFGRKRRHGGPHPEGQRKRQEQHRTDGRSERFAGAFIGLSYSTNNFLGLGETLSVSADIGSLQRNLTFGFTEPYLMDKPLQLGFTVYFRKSTYNQAQQTAILTGQSLNLPSAELQNLQNYTQSSRGFSVSLNYPLHRSFKRVGISYSYDDSSLVALSTASQALFTSLAFSGVSGPNALNGIITSKISPSFSENKLDSGNSPHSGVSIYAGGEIAGLGGTVRTVRPIFEYKKFIPVQNRRNTVGYRVQGSFLVDMAGWFLLRLSAFIWAVKTIFADSTFVRSRRLLFCRAQAPLRCAILMALSYQGIRTTRCEAATTFPCP